MSLANRVVLVVDDDPDICWALERVLGGLGARCTTGRSTAGPRYRQPGSTI